MSQKNETSALIGAALAVAALLGGLWWIFKKSDFSIGNLQPSDAPSAASGNPTAPTPLPPLPAGAPPAGSTFTSVGNIPIGNFKYGGSTSWAPVRLAVDSNLQQAKPEFRLSYVNPIGGAASTGSGVKMVINRDIDFAQTSRPLSAQERQQAEQSGIKLQEIPVAIDGLAVAVNPSLTLPGLTLEQLKGIYTGSVTNWQQVGGPNLPIVPISRKLGSGGTVDLFIESVLNGQSFGSGVQFVDTTTQALQSLGNAPGGIYFASAPEVVPQCTVKPIAIGRTSGQFVSPYQGNWVPKEQCPAQRTQLNPQVFRDSSYPLTRNLYVVFRADASGKAGEAYANLLLSGEGQGFLERVGFVKVR
jgi:phosphate transport system substrate-binding protein